MPPENSSGLSLSAAPPAGPVVAQADAGAVEAERFTAIVQWGWEGAANRSPR